MTKHSTKLNLYIVDDYLQQINKNTTIDTIIKLKSRAANCYKRAGGVKYTRKALNLYYEAYNMQCEIRGISHSRSLNLLSLVSQCEKRLDLFINNQKIKNNK